MKTLYLINSKNNNYHCRLAEEFRSIIPGEVIDMADGTSLGDRYYEIRDMNPDVIITFDLAGHALRTGSDTLSLNNIYARIAHILFHGSDYYGNDLRPRQNLSMFTYITDDEDISAFRERFPDIPNVAGIAPIYYKADNNDERAHNHEIIGRWWEEFKKEAML